MPDIPQAAITAAVRALRAHPWPDGETTEAQIATLVLEAAAPLLAEAWGVTERERRSEQLYAEYAKAMRELKDDGWVAPVPPEGKAENVSAQTAPTGEDGGL